MLEYLITSRARRALLTALWADATTGTVSALSRHAGISQAAAHKELRAMRRLGIAREVRSAGARTYEPNDKSPHAAALSALASLPTEPTAQTVAAKRPRPPDHNRIKNALAAHGAPLRGHRVSTRTDLSLEQTLAAGCQLSHDDPAVALAMPALLHQHHRTLHYPTFESALHQLTEKHTAGFLLALSAKLHKTPAMKRLAEPLRDNRRKRMLHFFSPMGTPRAAKDDYTLPIARDWHFHFPLPLANFPGA